MSAGWFAKLIYTLSGQFSKRYLCHPVQEMKLATFSCHVGTWRYTTYSTASDGTKVSPENFVPTFILILQKHVNFSLEIHFPLRFVILKRRI